MTGAPVVRGADLGSEVRELLRLAGPLVAIQAGNQLMGVVDTAVLGRVGTLEMGAVGLANGLHLVVSIVAIGTMMALDPLISQAIGARDPARARELVGQGAWLALGLSLLVVPGILVMPFLLPLIGVEAAITGHVRDYLHWRLPGIPAALAIIGMRGYLQAVGTTRVLVTSTIVANLVNLVLTILLVFGGGILPAWCWPLTGVPALGVAGSAIGTTVGNYVQLALVASAVTRGGASGARIARAPRREVLDRALRVGLPIGLHFGAEVAVFALAGTLAGTFGATALAAHQLALTLAALTFTVTVGMGSAASVRVGHAVGARDVGGARRRGLVAYGVGTAFMACSAALFVLFPRQLAGALTNQADVIAAAVPLLQVAAVFQISDGAQAVGAAVLRGAGDTRRTLAANLAGHWLVGLPLALGLAYGAGMGVVGLWWGLSAGLTTVGAILLARFLAISSRPIAPLASR